MQSFMKFTSNSFVVAVFTVFCATSAMHVRAQTPNAYVISAKAGRINAASGDVRVLRKTDAAWKDEIASGEVIRTGNDGRVEMLLNPGSYLRLGANSELELTDASLDNLQLKLTRGSAIVEATGTSGTRLFAQLVTPATKIMIDRNGLYRFNILPDGATEIVVRKGRVVTGNAADGAAMQIKGGKRIVVGSNDGGAEVVKLDKKQQDAFDFWSGERAEVLVAANRRLTERTVNNVFTSFRSSGAFGYGRSPYFGLWVYDGWLQSYTFLPFYAGWSSPYGFGYSNCFGLPWSYYRPSPPLAYINNPPRGGGMETIPQPDVPIRPGRQRVTRSSALGDAQARPLPPQLPERDAAAKRFERDFGNNSNAIDRRRDDFDGIPSRSRVPATSPNYEPAPTKIPPQRMPSPSRNTSPDQP